MYINKKTPMNCFFYQIFLYSFKDLPAYCFRLYKCFCLKFRRRKPKINKKKKNRSLKREIFIY